MARRRRGFRRRVRVVRVVRRVFGRRRRLRRRGSFRGRRLRIGFRM